MLSLKFYKPNINQWQEYKDLTLEALKNDPDGFEPTYDEAAKLEDKEWQDQLKEVAEGTRKCLLFLEINGKLAGMAGAYRMTSIPNAVKFKKVYLNKNYRGQGLGKKLIIALIDELKKANIKTIRLGVFTTQQPAIKMYKSLGFNSLDTLVENFPNGNTHESMRMELNI